MYQQAFISSKQLNYAYIPRCNLSTTNRYIVVSFIPQMISYNNLRDWMDETADIRNCVSKYYKI